jgi:hypothetical protein
MYDLARALSTDRPSLAIFAGGGDVTKQEMEANVDQGREMILLAGSGRTTDNVLKATRAEHGGSSRLMRIAQQGNIIPFGIEERPSMLARLIYHSLFDRKGDPR